MYDYGCALNDIHQSALTKIYNSQHNTSLTQVALSRKIENAIRLSNADVSFPLVVYWFGEVKAFCIVHFSRQEKIRSLGHFSFSIFTSADRQSLRFLFDSVFTEMKNRNFPIKPSSVIYGPVHNSILVNRGCRTFSGAPYTYQMPDNTSSLCEWVTNAGGVKEMDLLEIIYGYDSRDTLLTQVDERLLNRLKNINFEYVQKEKIAAHRQELSKIYNISWKHNWGASPTTADEIALAASSTKNIMGMIARRNGRIVGFTMMQFIEEAAGKMGRAFLSGVLPEYQQRGLSVLLTSKLSKIAIEEYGIKKFSISWMLEDNKMIVRTMKKLTRHGESQVRRYRIFSISQEIN